MPLRSISRKQIAPQPVLLIRRQIAQQDLQAFLSEAFGLLFDRGLSLGLPVAGAPFARFVIQGPELWAVEAGMPVATEQPGEGEIVAGELLGGLTACAVYRGPYDGLPAAVTQTKAWIQMQGFRLNGAHWESYVTDPAGEADPEQWQTEIFWPIN